MYIFSFCCVFKCFMYHLYVNDAVPSTEALHHQAVAANERSIAPELLVVLYYCAVLLVLYFFQEFHNL